MQIRIIGTEREIKEFEEELRFAPFELIEGRGTGNAEPLGIIRDVYYTTAPKPNHPANKRSNYR